METKETFREKKIFATKPRRYNMSETRTRGHKTAAIREEKDSLEMEKELLKLKTN